MKKRVLLLTVVTAFVFYSCDSVSNRSGSGNGNISDRFSDNWIIPTDEILDGGPGIDGIPSIDDPKFAPIGSGDLGFIRENRLITGIRVGDEVRAYPHQILDWHEVVNDKSDNTHFAITYCPLTGTDIAWIRGSNTEFGITGLLFRNNLILYDRNSFSRYSQMQIRGVNGLMAGTTMDIVPLVQTSWSTWKAAYPDSEILTTETGHEKDYRGFAYGEGYLSGNTATLFPIKNLDERFDRKERFHGVIRGTADENANVMVFRVAAFPDEIKLIEYSTQGLEAIVAGSSTHDFVVSFERILRDGTQLELEPVQNNLPVIMTDQEGNMWDLFGHAVEGPREGTRLQTVNSYTGYWFAWADFFPDLKIWNFD